ncbi:MAG: hypothetical protein WC876_03400 [Candidatus Thermoplasmatota archaeon]|jgi:hypothetical protein
MTTSRLNRIAVLLALLMLVFLPLVQSQPLGHEASFSAASLKWNASGEAAIGEFVAFRSREVGASTLIPATSPASELDGSFFELKAKQVDLESDVADIFLDAGGPVTASLPPLVHTERASLTDVVVVGTNAREGQMLYAFPVSDGKVEVKVECATAVASPIAVVHAPTMLGAREPIDADTSGALEIAPCADSEIVLKGDFIVVLWERDGTLTSAQGPADFWSGKREQETAPDPTGTLDGRPFASKAQQSYITVHDGKLRMKSADLLAPLLYMNAIDAKAASSVTMTDAIGEVGTEHHAATGRTVRLDGALDVRYQRQGNAVSVNVMHGIEAVTVDGQPLRIESVAVNPGGSGALPLSWILVSALGLVATPLTVQRLRIMRRHRVDGLLYICDRLFNRLRFEEMNETAARALDMAPQNPEAHMQRARALEQLGHFSDSQTHRGMAHQLLQAAGNQALAARNAVHAADAAAHFQLHPVALRWIRQALMADPTVRDDIIQLPTLQPLLSHLEADATASIVPFWQLP